MGIDLDPDPLPRRATTSRSTSWCGPGNATATPFAEWLSDSYEPVDPLFRLAQQTCVVLLPGAGFDGPAWSVRVSLANLDDDAYFTIGKCLVAIIRRVRRRMAGPLSQDAGGPFSSGVERRTTTRVQAPT